MRALTCIGREADCEVTDEEVVPELLQGEPGDEGAVEARLDLGASSPPS